VTQWLNAHAIDLWTIVVAILCSVPCALLGCYLVLRRMSLLSDAISHSVLPGLAVAFLLTGSVSGWGMVLGAVILGIGTAFLTQSVSRLTDVAEDATMGVVFTSLFAAGVLLMTWIAPQVDLDPGCVLYGAIEFTAIDTVPAFGLEIPKVIFSQFPTLLATVGFIVLCWKELKLISFDPALAAAMGFRVGLIHYLLMAWVAGVTVVSFEAVGSILVIAMMIVPAATAQLLTERMTGMMIWSAMIAIVSAVFGYWGALVWNTSVAGMMATVSGICFLLAVFLAPQQGLIPRAIRRFRLSLRILEEDILAGLYRGEEETSTPIPLRTGTLQALAIRRLIRSGNLQSESGHLVLTEAGREMAKNLVRNHRLWESFLSARLELPADHVHDPAERMEHYITRTLQEKIVADLADPGTDPHGRPIPNREKTTGES
jgi:manganese/zinc/iron transport system permease protein